MDDVPLDEFRICTLVMENIVRPPSNEDYLLLIYAD